jgi:hypothetical protein
LGAKGDQGDGEEKDDEFHCYLLCWPLWVG